ncbi:MAG: hypothetical protein IJR14_11415 [Synergistaceae bacterium]|nr:hypothetical protein [Synergistaceae bacterium]
MRDDVPQQVEELLDRAYEAEDEHEARALVERALDLDPEDPEALLFLADLTEDDDERMSILSGAIEAVRVVLREMGTPEDEFMEDELGTVYLALLQRAAFTLFAMGDDGRALAMTEELGRHELDDGGASRDLHYRILVEMEDWSRVLDEAERDYDHQLGRAWGRTIATFMLGDREGAAQMFWEAMIMSPEIPFYVLGYFPEPTEGAPEEEDFNFACLWSDAFGASRELLNWISRGTILFGLLSGRFDDAPRDGLPGSEADAMLEILGSLGGREEHERMSGRVCGGGDEEIIEALASARCLADEA